MKYGDFRKIMVADKVAGPYLFIGDEGLMMDKTIDYIVDKNVEETFKDFNYTLLHGENLEMENFYSSVETLPFMSEKRVVIVNQLGEFIKQNNLSDTFFETLESTSDDTILIFHDSEDDLKKNTKLYKFFKKINKVVEFDKLNNFELSNYIKGEIQNKNKTISDSDLSYFIMLTGYQNRKLEINLYELDSELEKLIAYASGNKITRQDINKTIKKQNDSNIFNLLDSLASKNSKNSLDYLYDLYEKNEPLYLIFNMIQRRFRHLYEYVSLSKDNISDREIQKIMGVKNYEYKVVGNAARGKSLCDLRDDLEKIVEVDKKLKTTSKMELLLLEYLVVYLCK